MGALPESERERRRDALQQLIAAEGLDALVLAANDYRGHKGTLRWVGDFNLAHRHGYALAAPGRDPALLLPENLALQPLGEWPIEVAYARNLGSGLAAALAELSPGRIGVVGLGQVMKVEDYLAVRAALPEAEIVDATMAFERVRAAKVPVELEGAREATRIAEAAFARLLEVAGAGVGERQIGAEVTRVALAEGGEDPLFLTMYGRERADGTVGGHFGIPVDRVLRRGDIHTFSFELTGPLGYWMELSRMVVIGPPDELATRLNASVAAGLRAGGDALAAGALPGAAQAAIEAAAAEYDTRCAYWSGHGIGQDVIEEPWVGLDVVQDRDAPPPEPLAADMVLSLHPFVIDNDDRGIGYMADTFIVGDGGAKPISSLSRDLYEVD
ncbi:MAG TPA: M24 family metallopeptidase [Solirubrobacterales bacterium]|nr:M24 family metallopeptidase [Solirubrobacterales bacterium]